MLGSRRGGEISYILCEIYHACMMDGFCIDAPNYAFLIASIKFTIRIYLHYHYHIYHNNNTTYSHTCAIKCPFCGQIKFVCKMNKVVIRQIWCRWLLNSGIILYQICSFTFQFEFRNRYLQYGLS